MNASARLGAFLFFALLCRVACAGGSAPAVADKDCVALVGLAEPSPNDEERARYVQLAHAGVDEVASELRRRHVESKTFFNEQARPSDDPRPGHVGTILDMISSHCARLVQLSFRAKDDKGEPVIGFDVSVVRVDVTPGSDGGAPVTIRGITADFSKHYFHARTTEALATFDVSQDAARIADDLVASGAIPAAR